MDCFRWYPTYMFCTGTASILHDRIFILYRLYCKLTDCKCNPPRKSLASVFTKPRRIKHVVANSLVIIITVAIMKSVIIVIFLVQTIQCDEEASEKAQSTVVRSYYNTMQCSPKHMEKVEQNFKKI